LRKSWREKGEKLRLHLKAKQKLQIKIRFKSNKNKEIALYKWTIRTL